MRIIDTKFDFDVLHQLYEAAIKARLAGADDDQVRRDSLNALVAGAVRNTVVYENRERHIAHAVWNTRGVK